MICSEDVVFSSETKPAYSADKLFGKHLCAISGLGRLAVANNLIRTKCSDVLANEPQIAANIDMNIKESLRAARTDLRANAYPAVIRMMEFKQSPWLYNAITGRELTAKTEEEKLESVTRMVTYIRAGRGKTSVSDETFMNFLEWYNSEHARLQRGMSVKYKLRKAAYKRAVKSAVQDGWIPESVIKDNLPKINDVPMAIDDGYRIDQNKDSKNTTSAQYSVVDNSILFKSKESISYSIIHELNHAVSSEYPDNDYVGGVCKLFGKGKGSVAINEAVTEHIAQGLSGKPIDIIRPLGKVGAYIKERELLDTLCNKGVEPIDIRHFIAAYFESAEKVRQLKNKSKSKKLLKSLAKAFPNINVQNTISSIKNDEDDILRVNHIMIKSNYGFVRGFAKSITYQVSRLLTKLI